MRSILLYVLLVGVPALGLSALMRFGRRLTPPISVAGTWSVQKNFQVVEGSPCVDPFRRSNHPVLTITQSGTHLLVKLNDEGDTLTAQIYGPNTEALSGQITGAVKASSRDTTKILFRAAIDRRTKPDRLVGEFNFINRPLCPSLAFTATRDSTIKRTEGQ